MVFPAGREDDHTAPRKPAEQMPPIMVDHGGWLTIPQVVMTMTMSLVVMMMTMMMTVVGMVISLTIVIVMVLVVLRRWWDA